jgi:hypothetical protein
VVEKRRGGATFMSCYFDTHVFLGYELGKEIEDLVTKGEIPDDYIEDLFENNGIDYVLDGMSGKFLYVGRSLSHKGYDDEAGATELPILTAADYMELKEKLCKTPLLKELIGDKMPKLYHVYYYN